MRGILQPRHDRHGAVRHLTHAVERVEIHQDLRARVGAAWQTGNSSSVDAHQEGNAGIGKPSIYNSTVQREQLVMRESSSPLYHAGPKRAWGCKVCLGHT